MALRRSLLLIGFCLAFLLSGQMSQARETVGVLAYPFPPFLNEDERTGVTVETIAFLNQIQKDYTFVLRTTSAKRRYADFEARDIDLMLFEMPEWDWHNRSDNLASTDVIVTGGERMITRAEPGRSQDYFNFLDGKAMAGYLGYHYGFAHMRADTGYLKDNFRIALHTSHEEIIEKVLDQRADIGIVTQSFLETYLTRFPVREDLLISENLNQHYRLRAIIKKDAPISRARLEDLLRQLAGKPAYRDLLERNSLYRDWLLK